MGTQIVYTCTGEWVDIKSRRPRDRQVVMVETEGGKLFLSEYSMTSDQFYSRRDSSTAIIDVVRWSPVRQRKLKSNNADQS